MRYLVARGANSRAELEDLVEVAKEILTPGIRAITQGCTVWLSIRLTALPGKAKKIGLTMSRGSPSEPSHGETL